MEPNNMNVGAELPSPEHLTPKIDINEVVAPGPDSQPELVANQGERINAASSAIVQATDDDSQAIIIAEDNADDDLIVPQVTKIHKADIPADDVDVIEKEWVEKAKDIVDKTKDDPNQQSSQLAGLKKTYVETRYGKNINNNTNST